MMTDRDREGLAIRIFKAGCVKIADDGFTLNLHNRNPGAPRAPIYFNLRTPRHPKNRGLVTGALLEEIVAHLADLIIKDNIDFSHVAGVPRAGDPFAKGIARYFNKGLVILNKKDAEAGSFPSIDGIIGQPPPVGSNILLVENILTQGGSALEAAEFLFMACHQVSHLATIVDWEGGARKRFDRSPVRLAVHSLFTVRELIDLYVQKQCVGPKLKDRVTDFAQFLRGLPG